MSARVSGFGDRDAALEAMSIEEDTVAKILLGAPKPTITMIEW